MPRTLYEIGNDMAALEALLIETDGDISDPRVAEAVAKWESEIEGDMVAKIDGYCSLIAEIERRSQARYAESDRLKKLAETDENAADALRERLRFVFELRNLKPVQTAHFRVSLAKNGGKSPMVIDAANDELPAWAIERVESVVANKDAIRARLEAGEQLSFARLLERGTRISIK